MRSNCRTRTTDILVHVGLPGFWQAGDQPAALYSERPRANRPMCAEQGMPQLLSGPIPNMGDSARFTAELPAPPVQPKNETLSAASFGNVPSYDRTDVLLNTFAWWPDDAGAKADAFLAAGCARLVLLPVGIAIDDDRW
jgi:hypothetical protein